MCEHSSEQWCKTVDGHHVHTANNRVVWCEDWSAIPLDGTAHLQWDYVRRFGDRLRVD